MRDRFVVMSCVCHCISTHDSAKNKPCDHDPTAEPTTNMLSSDTFTRFVVVHLLFAGCLHFLASIIFGGGGQFPFVVNWWLIERPLIERPHEREEGMIVVVKVGCGCAFLPLLFCIFCRLFDMKVLPAQNLSLFLSLGNTLTMLIAVLFRRYADNIMQLANKM